MRAALRRLALLLVATATGVGAVGALVGVLTGTSLGRSISLAFYLAGAFLVVLGFFAGNRGPLRGRVPDERAPVAGLFGVGLGVGGARRATRGERRDALATAAIFLGLGAWLIVLGVAADASVALF